MCIRDSRYDVPFRSRDGFRQEEGSEQQFSYILCSICPVKETKPVLRYDSAEGKFHERGTDWVAAAPEVGFLFPAFDDRATNLYGALYYTCLLYTSISSPSRTTRPTAPSALSPRR